MLQRKLVNTFKTAELCKRASKLMRKKYKKTLKPSEARKIWADYCEYAIIQPLLEFGRVSIDEHTTMEILGTRFENNNKLLALMSKGLNKKGIVKKAVPFNPTRFGVSYKIILTDTHYRGVTVFKANEKLKERVKDRLNNTQTYYRILR